MQHLRVRACAMFPGQVQVYVSASKIRVFVLGTSRTPALKDMNMGAGFYQLRNAT